MIYDSYSGKMSAQLRFRYSFPLLVGMSFFVINLFNVMNHEMWRDELQAWVIAQNSDSIINLFENLQYEGHPGLWHLFLYILGKFVAHPIVMQIFHVCLATSVIYIVVVYSPFTSLQKIVFTFGYFPFYEYAVISRNYALGVLGVVAFCTLYPTRKKRYTLIAICLFLLCQTNVYGLMFALLFCGLLILDFCTGKNCAGTFQKRKRDILFSLVIIFFGICLSLVQLIPPSDSGFAMGWHYSFDLLRVKRVFASIWNGYVPIPKMQVQFWNSNILDNLGWGRVMLSAILFILSCGLLSRTPVVMGVFGVGTAGMLLFQYVKYPGYLRHHGHLLILLICCMWLSSNYQPMRIKFASTFVGNIDKYKRSFLTVILFANLIAGSIAVIVDWAYPFSASKAVATYIEKHQMGEMFLVGDNDFAASAVAAYLERELYYPRGNRTGTFIIWDTKRTQQAPPNVFFGESLELGNQYNKDVLFILNYEIDSPGHTISSVAEFTDCIVDSEQYYLYIVEGEENIDWIEDLSPKKTHGD